MKRNKNNKTPKKNKQQPNKQRRKSGLPQKGILDENNKMPIEQHQQQ